MFCFIANDCVLVRVLHVDVLNTTNRWDEVMHINIQIDVLR